MKRFFSCTGNNKNPATHLMTKEQKASLHTITNINEGLLYTMDYTADYKLEDVLNTSVSDVKSLTAFINNSLLDGHAGGGSTIDAGWIGYGIHSLSDGKTDLSMAVGFPYLIMDGMNEKGVAISVLKLDGDGTCQNTGKTVVIEYCNNDLTVLDAHFITNYYISPSMNQYGHGKDRYNVIKATLGYKKDRLTVAEAMSLLESISQTETEESTSMTQWSVIYDLTELKATVAIRREFKRLFHFCIKDRKA